jgi:hypothetical protein
MCTYVCIHARVDVWVCAKFGPSHGFWSIQGHFLARHAFVLVAPKPQAEIRVCSQRHTFEEVTFILILMHNKHVCR